MKERFERWQGPKANLMKDYIDSALLFIPFVALKNDLYSIKKEFAGKGSEPYHALNLYKKRDIAGFLYCKLRLEEVLEQIAGKNYFEEGPLLKLDKLLEEAYSKPWHEVKGQFLLILKQIKEFMELDFKLIVEKKHVKSLLFDLYTVLNIIDRRLKRLSAAKKFLLSAYINLDDLRVTVTELLRLTEAKTKGLDSLLSLIPVPESPELDNENEKHFITDLQSYFKNECSELESIDQLEGQALSKLEQKITTFSAEIKQLIESKEKKERLDLKKQKMEAFIKAINESEQSILGKNSLLNLIESYSEDFDLLMKKTQIEDKKDLLEQIEQLKAPSYIQSFWQWTPNWVQDYVPSSLTFTRDKKCIGDLRKLAEAYLSRLKETSSLTEVKIGAAQRRVFNEREEFPCKERLLTLQTSINTASKMLQEYCRISDFLLGVVWHLHLIDESSQVLKEFIHLHNNFLIQFLHFLSRICSVFKTNTVFIVGKARTMTKELHHYSLRYQMELNEGLKAIRENPELDPFFKEKLQSQINERLRDTKDILPNHPSSKEEVSYLIKSLAKLYSNSKSPQLLEEAETIPGYTSMALS